MSLTGEKLGPYEIVAPIGKGGMGEVYRARDPRLGRDVAIKVSSEKFSERFEREARVIASLNHPNICALYDVGPNYLVMELVEGESPRGPLPLETALDYALQIANALGAAHEKGITHRDLKPANIKVTPGGVVKVLDFGLAKVGGGATAVSEDSPTLSIGETQAGIILGTAAYMSPEQAKGKPVDKQTDIWAFGVVLYEMLIGRRPFEGDTLQETMASVLKEEIKLDRAPAKVRPLLEACLQKDPKRRLHDIADAKLLLREDDVKPVRTASSKLPWLAAAMAVIAAAVIGFVHFREAPPVVQATRFQIDPPLKTSFGIYVSVAPDGSKLAFTASGMDGRIHLWVRDMDALQARELPGTEIRGGFGSPFWSPDSKFVAYSDQNRLLKVDASGASLPQVIVQVPNANIGQGTWSKDGIIIFGGRGSGALRQVSESGGEAKPLTVVDQSRQESAHTFPFFLRDGKHFLYLRGSRAPDKQGIYIGSLDAKPEQQSLERVVASTFEAVYAPANNDAGGNIVYLEEDGTLMARPFDASKLALAGPPARIAERVGFNNAYGFFSVSAAGVLAYRGAARPRDSQPTWFDRDGNEIRPDGDSFQTGGGVVRLSPDGTRLAETRLENRNIDVWVWEFTRGIGTRLTFNLSNDADPVWSPDGSQIAFNSNRDSGRGIYVKPANGASEEKLLITQPTAGPESWSSDGKYLLFTAADEHTRRDIWVLPIQGDGKPVVFLRTPFEETSPRFSPDARWVAYVSNESGRSEVYVLPFAPPGGAPVQGGKWQVSKDGGAIPVWTKNGSELIYVAPDGSVMAVDVTTGNAFHAGVPQKLFKAPAANSVDVTSDGQKFLFTVPAGDNTPSPITVVTNWEASLKK